MDRLDKNKFVGPLFPTAAQQKKETKALEKEVNLDEKRAAREKNLAELHERWGLFSYSTDQAGAAHI